MQLNEEKIFNFSAIIFLTGEDPRRMYTFAHEVKGQEERTSKVDLACLANPKRLEWLNRDGSITDAGMANLAGLTNLEQLFMGGSNLTDKGLSYAANMMKLMYLKIGGDFSDKRLTNLEGLTGLMSLEIASQRDFSAETLQCLRGRLPIFYSLRVEKGKEE